MGKSKNWKHRVDWPFLDRGVLRLKIVIVPYDKNWPSQYATEARRLQKALQAFRGAIEHIGSTAVPGLCAKPIIDIMIGLPELSQANETVAPMQKLGYEYVPEFEEQMPDRRFFRLRHPDSPQYNVHIVEINDDFWERHVVFRDYLRRCSDVARRYSELKMGLAARDWEKPTDYTEAKSEFIIAMETEGRQILDQSRMARS